MEGDGERKEGWSHQATGILKTRRWMKPTGQGKDRDARAEAEQGAACAVAPGPEGCRGDGCGGEVQCRETPVETDSVSIRLGCWNVLAQDYIKNEWYPYCPPEFLHRKYRTDLMLKEIDALSAHVWCFQEIEESFLRNVWGPSLESRGFSYVFVKKDSTKKKDGCAVFWRTDTLQVEHVQEIHIDQLARELCEVKLRQREGEQIEYPDRLCWFSVGLAVSLSFKDPVNLGPDPGTDTVTCCPRPRPFTVGTLHTYWDQRMADTQTLQVSLVLRSLVSSPHVRPSACTDKRDERGGGSQADCWARTGSPLRLKSEESDRSEGPPAVRCQMTGRGRRGEDDASKLALEVHCKHGVEEKCDGVRGREGKEGGKEKRETRREGEVAVEGEDHQARHSREGEGGSNGFSRLILCGDFNSTPDSCVYALISQGLVPTRMRGDQPGGLRSTPASLQSPSLLDSLGEEVFCVSPFKYGMWSAMASCSPDGLTEPEFTTVTHEFAAPLDYIFVPRQCEGIRLVGALSMPERGEVGSGIPNERYPSDHVSLLSEFEVN
uniref:Endonuclease/exonuclease/phosphatase domain-containing protein n=1 Tax=Chromera velia CCMP2878 TaxID=1169474 RepID=A0A0G4HTV3_9ALVE|eukprot:Cvel_1354.t1-p1 / transcript=Cvel_1354.t1 / gene=Cvel_1354 / organism=Chromera_velia_CCMP2878 / gene_product=Carbon catabolite repressor protein 4 homolog 4, putative / transcript_product=Carbon catabolite repressor protein 4 homolog 4, putative / location=Cvel_scaffold46:117512-119152(-) / protein_length=547 / sequence_SO=supercontig / SO=protein_coding / is_pseudo=false